jgi:hypothetical protein
MTSVHQELIARLSHPDLNAILLDTPFGFQENADEMAASIIAYFGQYVGCEPSVRSWRNAVSRWRTRHPERAGRWPGRKRMR